jgi:transposase InsO family protein
MSQRNEKRKRREHQRNKRWAEFRFGVVGHLLVAQHEKGGLQDELRKLAAKKWVRPGWLVPTPVGFSTIERWYYLALNEKADPIGALQRKVRGDLGAVKAMGEPLRRALQAQYLAHKRWSYQLHHDNLRAAAEADKELGAVPHYATVRRYMKAHAMLRLPRRGNPNRPGVQLAEQRLESHEVRSWEVEQPNALWHLDFHSCSRPVLTAKAVWVTPQLLGIIDDHSRLCCHLQWYLSETAEHLVHGLCQAFAKRGLPRALMTDNGSAMTAGETVTGLLDSSVVHETTLPYSPYQNGKQECFWAQVEGRLMAMLERVKDLTLDQLNEATQAWVEMEYNRKHHDEIGEPPLTRWLKGKDAGRPCPPSEELRLRFTERAGRRQRRSDGTISLASIRFELPSRFRHLEKVDVRYAAWDLSHVWLWDERQKQPLARIVPLDKRRNADGQRRALPAPNTGADAVEPQSGLPPLLQQCLDRYRATGLPPAYLPKSDTQTEEELP